MNDNNKLGVAEFNKLSKEYAKVLFAKYGFKYGRNCFFRKNGNTFQALKLYGYSGGGTYRLLFLVIPFWCDLSYCFPEEEKKLSSVFCEKACNWCLFSTQDYEYNHYYLTESTVKQYLDSFIDSNINIFDSIIDEYSYVNYLMTIHPVFVGSQCSEDAIIFVSQQQNSNLAEKYIDYLNSFFVNKNFDRNLVKDPCTLYIDLNEKAGLDYELSCELLMNAKNFPKIMAYIKGEKTDIKSVYKDNSIKMREIYYRIFKLSF